MSEQVVILGARRTPIGAFQGALAAMTASQLGAAAARAAIEDSGLAPDQLDEVILGCVLQAGQGQAPARQAALGAGIALGVPATTVNKMCGSGMKAAMFAHDLLAAGSADIIVAGGMESMTNAPYLLPKARAGLRMGHGQVLDHMFYDGLEDAYEKGRLMGTFAEDCAGKYGFSREAQDDFAIHSLKRAQKANREGWFAWEITPIAIKSGKEQKFVEMDEQPFKANFEKIPQLKPAFRKDGTVTAANSSSISDGAAALVVFGVAQIAHASGFLVDQLAEGDSHRHFVVPRPFHMAANAEHSGASALRWGTDRREPFGAPPDNVGKVGQGLDVAQTVSQRRNGKGDHVNAVVEVFPEVLTGHLVLQGSIGGRDDPHIRRDGDISPHAFDDLFLEDAQEEGLEPRGEVRHLVPPRVRRAQVHGVGAVLLLLEGDPQRPRVVVREEQVPEPSRSVRVAPLPDEERGNLLADLRGERNDGSRYQTRLGLPGGLGASVFGVSAVLAAGALPLSLSPGFFCSWQPRNRPKLNRIANTANFFILLPP